MRTGDSQPAKVHLTEDGIRAGVRNFLLSTFYLASQGEMKDDTSLLETGIVDSTGVLEIIQFLEVTFGFKVEDDEIVPENLDSVEHLVRYVSSKVAQAGAQ